jgi:hypothetical protein
MVFWKHWIGVDLVAIPDPHFAVTDIGVRSLVAWAYGRQARDALDKLVKTFEDEGQGLEETVETLTDQKKHELRSGPRRSVEEDLRTRTRVEEAPEVVGFK